ncbi:EF-P 5-aminopentanol modification-associated protein YfmH [Vagococcus intermedius]|uniref:Insulinase family protein n=1 Tax=Vagococcus intermedius TaxID=2991418 RepID=A0AAF0I7K0_9ENTE|nr:pitrilysin family protein [Vagococcus intermedius]WEG73425.1 insulinase family protein [Vagococcus intermedius]WEG75508.1 insulinase family protein [Vagococcus intermedius]
MEKINYPGLNETLYKETLPNGLNVILLPKLGFNKTYGLFTTNYGSIDNRFVPLGEHEIVEVPDGIAHFLEHKMFEKEDGDVFQQFGAQGASANAFTSFTRTSYLFSSTTQINENITTLLDFVQAPYFTEETVEKEKGIIGQEIQMYQDDANWRLFFGIIGNLYPTHPLHIDIAGTIESIADITAEDLYLCYRTFYHPSNMNLLVVGNMEPETMMAHIRHNQANKSFPDATLIEREFPEVTTADIIKKASINMPVNRSKVIVGLKGTKSLPTEGFELLRYQTAVNLLLQLLFGDTSSNREIMYNEGLIDDSFGYDFSLDRGYYFADFGGDSKEPERLVEKIRDILLTATSSSEITEPKLRLLKKKMLGKYLQSLNSLEYIANRFSQMQFGDATLFDMAEVIESITLDDIYKAIDHFIQEDALSEFYMYPEDH